MKGSFIVTFIAIIVVLCVLVNSSYALDPKKVVGAWSFDEGKGAVVGDSSGNGHDGKVIGGTKWINGKFGKALEFIGGDSVEIPDDEALEFGTNSFSVVIWFNFSKSQDWNRLVRVRNPGAWGGGNTGWELQTQGVLVHWSLDDTQKNNLQSTYDNAGDGTWHHTAMIINREKKTMLTYLDADKEKSTNIANIVSISANVPTTFGGGYVGSIDDVAIFNGVITQDDVKAIMDKSLPEVLKGNASVSSLDKTASVWGAIKSLE